MLKNSHAREDGAKLSIKVKKTLIISKVAVECVRIDICKQEILVLVGESINKVICMIM